MICEMKTKKYDTYILCKDCDWKNCIKSKLKRRSSDPLDSKRQSASSINRGGDFNKLFSSLAINASDTQATIRPLGQTDCKLDSDF